MSPRPRIGDPTLLVYRECMCGEWCATGEGAVAPICAVCGRRMLPLGTAELEDGRPMFCSDKREQRRLRGLAFYAVLSNELAVAENLSRLRRLLGTDALLTHQPQSPLPYAAGEGREIELALKRIGFPTDRQWDRAPDMPDEVEA